jgi:hypothetical protein
MNPMRCLLDTELGSPVRDYGHSALRLSILGLYENYNAWMHEAGGVLK